MSNTLPPLSTLRTVAFLLGISSIALPLHESGTENYDKYLPYIKALHE